MKFHQDTILDKKVIAFDNSVTKAVWPSWLGTTPKRCELPLFFAAIGQATRSWKALDLGSLNMQFQQDWPKDKNITVLLIFSLKTEKFRSTELYDAPLKGLTIFLAQPTSRTTLDSSQLGELKYAFFSSTGCKTKKLPRSKLFLSMVLSMGS